MTATERSQSRQAMASPTTRPSTSSFTSPTLDLHLELFCSLPGIIYHSRFLKQFSVGGFRTLISTVMHSLAFLSLDKQTVNTDVVLVIQVLMVEDSRVFIQVRIITEAGFFSFLSFQD